MTRTLGWLWSLAFGAVFIFFLFHGPDERVLAYRELVGRHSQALALVARTDCSDHGNVFYEFEVDGKRYSGSTYSLGRPCDSVLPGESVSIYFDPEDPTVNTTMRPDVAFDFHRSQLLTKFFMAFAMLCIVAYPIVQPRMKNWAWAKRAKDWIDGA
jgi:hypothetical protein